ncbi:MAG: SGNH/GDSL hydrolase family protein [Armatimonadota bacterium]
MIIEPGSKLVFIGDSVTDCGRTQPIGEGLGDALGRGYVSLVDALLVAAYPEHKIRIVNVGTSGNTVRDLKGRWQRDVLDLRPDWLSVMIGINDVWRQFDMPRKPEAGVDLDAYEATLREIVGDVRPRLKGLILMTPFYIEPSESDAMRARMDAYGEVVRRLASEYDALFVDTQAAFSGVLDQFHSSAIAWDRVHPNHIGHMVLARALLEAVGFNWAGSGDGSARRP